MYRGYDGAGVSYTELEVLPDFSGINTLSTGIVGGASRGPLTKTKITNAKQMRKIFGDPVEGDWGVWAALKVLKNSNLIWYKRVVNTNPNSPDRAAFGVSSITGKLCKYQFTTKNYDEYLNGVKIVVTQKPGTSVNKTSVSDEILQKDVVNAAGGKVTNEETHETVYNNVLDLGEGEMVHSIKKVYTDLIEYTEGLDFEVDYKTGVVTWKTRENAPIAPPAANAKYNVLYTKSRVQTEREPDLYDVTLTKNGSMLEKLTNFNLIVGDDNYILTAFNDRSDYLTIAENTAFVPTADNAYPDLNGTYTVGGGCGGYKGIPDEAYVGTKGTDEGLQDFLDPEALDISTLIVPGITSDSVIAAGIEVAESRGDIVFVVDTPQGLTPQQADKFSRRKGDWTPTQSNKLHQIDSKFCAMYYPWVMEYIPEFAANCWTPPSAWVASQFAYNDTVAHTWFAPAGFQSGSQGRGVLTAALDIEHNCTQAERDILYADDNGCVNPIVGFVGKGITIWGNRTTLRTGKWAVADSSFTQLSVRRLCNYCRKVIIKTSMETLFQPNTETFWKQWRVKVEQELQRIKEGEGIEAYRVQMDRTTISDEDIYYGRAPGKVFIKPVHAIEWIPITFTVTHDSVIFEEGNTSVEE